MLIYITLIDSLIFLGFEAYPLCVIISGFLIYFLKNKSADSIMLSIIIFFLTYVFAKHIKRLRDSIKKIEYLYDENRNYSYELEETKKRIENFAKMVEKVSQLEERNRISREIHDSIGHKLTGILMQLEACIRVGEVDEKKSKELLHLVRDNLKQCSETLRQTVKGLKPTKIKDRMLSIKQMISSFEKATCVKINYQIRGMRYKLNPSIEMVIYRNIQEALTNSVRHGKASAIDVILEYNDDKIVLSVRDNGVGCDQIHAGMGISGMDERVRVIGGKIEIYNGNGLIIKTVIPIIMKQVV
ncbi:MAG: sensor histidine kinase [Bacillota bacterium]|nr:sensor histidine kinase [Bacillota bacterium]